MSLPFLIIQKIFELSTDKIKCLYVQRKLSAKDMLSNIVTILGLDWKFLVGIILKLLLKFFS